MSLINHIENYLGPISKGIKDNNCENDIQISIFDNMPCDDVSTFVTLGLSHHILNISDSKKVRQELMFSVCQPIQASLVGSLLLAISEKILLNHKALLCGQIIRLEKEFLSKIGFNSDIKFSDIWCAPPLYFDNELGYYYGSEPATVIVYLVPIFESEANFIEEKGWMMFQDIILEREPDLFLLTRPAIV